MVWMSSDLPWLEKGGSGVTGRPQVYTDAAIQAILTLKVLCKLSLRQACGLVRSLVKLVGSDWPVPCFSTVSRRQATLAVKIPVWHGTEPLHLLVDSTGEGGRSKSMAPSAAVPGVRCIWPLMPRPWISGRWR